MSTSGIRFSNLDSIASVTDNDYLLANDASSGTSKKVDVKVLTDHIRSNITSGVAQIVAGDGVSITPSTGTGIVEINVDGAGLSSPGLNEVLSVDNTAIGQDMVLVDDTANKMSIGPTRLTMQTGRVDIQHDKQPFLIIDNRTITLTTGTGSDVTLSNSGVNSIGGFVAGNSAISSTLSSSGLKIDGDIHIVKDNDDLKIINRKPNSKIIIENAELTNPKVSDVLNLNTLVSLPEIAETGDICQFNKEPYFFDGIDWRRFYLYNRPGAPDVPDPAWSNVFARMTFNDDTTNVSDLAMTSISSSVYIDDTNSKFGGGSLKLASSPRMDYEFITHPTIVGDFTSEFWYYPTSAHGQQIISIIYRTQSAGSVYYFNLRHATSNLLTIENSNSSLGSTNAPVTLNAWNHICVMRARETVDIFLNGTLCLNVFFNPVMIVQAIQFSGPNTWIDDYRLTDDQRYSQNFGGSLIDIPTAQLPTST
jgi:hypothetical protein